jgi:hypothetical protein
MIAEMERKLLGVKKTTTMCDDSLLLNRTTLLCADSRQQFIAENTVLAWLGLLIKQAMLSTDPQRKMVGRYTVKQYAHAQR